MRKQLPLLVLLLLPFLALATSVTVPKNVYFADVHLKISDEAQQEIQKKVDALHRNQTYFRMKVELADAYFPIIERVFKEEGVPDDFKYLALQESGLIGDAVSTSNAVGYWQFKKEAAMDFNLRMDNLVDERRHIIEASRGAARYFKRSNTNYDNWFTSLLSYYLGYTGVKTYSSPSDKGAKKMEVTEKSHPYVITFLAHKIAYDAFVGKNKPVVALQEVRALPGQSLADIALSTKTDFVELERYNKWLLGNSIPSDKDYYVMVPVRGGDSGLLASKGETAPALSRSSQQMAAAIMVKRNGLNALVARQNDTKDKLALQAGISTRKFLRYNDLHNFDPIVAGASYYIEKKNTSAEKEQHVVQPGETMQMISQHYGIRLNYLLYKNRMGRTETPVPGRVLWLQKRRPASTAVEIRDLNQKQRVAAVVPAKKTEKVTSNNQTLAKKEAEEPQENIFKRFINSFRRFKKEPEPEKAIAAVTPEAPIPVKQTEKEVVAQPETSVVQPETSVAHMEPATSQQTQAVEKKPAPVALYPVKQDTPAKAEAVKPEAKPAVTEADSISVELLEAEEPEVEEQILLEASPETMATPVVKHQASPGASKHLVKQGETLYGISRMYAVTINDLTSWNNLGDEPLKLGHELLIAEPLTLPASVPASPLSEPAPYTMPGNGTHTVVAGETLYQISKTYNVPLADLRAWNNMPDNNIRIGQELVVSAPASSQAPAPVEQKPTAPTTSTGGTYHTVAGGESMYQISRKYGVTIKYIMEWNNKSDFAVSVGEKLLIRKK